MANGDRVPGNDLMLRRFDPSNKTHWWFDQAGTGEKHLRSGNLSYGADGFSVYQDPKLAALELPREVVLEDLTWGIVGLTAGEIRELERGERKLLDVIEDEFPNGREDAPACDAAHALIVLPSDISKSQISAWGKKLSENLEVVPFERSTPDAPDEVS
jgi:hypothetical protein